jgi:hypothetical protein
MPNTPSVTTFVETAALWHVMNEHHAEARRIVTEMSPGERATYASQLDRLRSMLTDDFGNDLSVADQHTCLLPPNRIYRCGCCPHGDCPDCGHCKHRCECPNPSV